MASEDKSIKQMQDEHLEKMINILEGGPQIINDSTDGGLSEDALYLINNSTAGGMLRGNSYFINSLCVRNISKDEPIIINPGESALMNMWSKLGISNYWEEEDENEDSDNEKLETSVKKFRCT